MQKKKLEADTIATNAQKKDNDRTLLVIWDFDWTMINENSDTWVVKELSKQAVKEGRPEASGNEYTQMKELSKSMQWTDLMAEFMLRLTGKEGLNFGKDDVKKALVSIPFFLEMFDVVRLLAADPRCCQCIVSDANTFFIDSILEAHELSACFNGGIFTNPAHWDANETLCVKPFVDEATPHGCSTCDRSPNMCKGQIVDQLVERHGPFSQTIYLGDGSGDFCGARHVGKPGLLLGRRGYPLMNRVHKEDDANFPRVLEWESGEEVRAHLLREGVIQLRSKCSTVVCIE